MSLINEMLRDLDRREHRSYEGSCLCQRGSVLDVGTLGIPPEMCYSSNKYSSATIALVFAGVVPGGMAQRLPAPDMEQLLAKASSVAESRFAEKQVKMSGTVDSAEYNKGEGDSRGAIDALSQDSFASPESEIAGFAALGSSSSDSYEVRPHRSRNDTQPRQVTAILPTYISPVRRRKSVGDANPVGSADGRSGSTTQRSGSASKEKALLSSATDGGSTVTQRSTAPAVEKTNDASFISVVQRPLSVEQQISSDLHLAVETYQKGNYPEAERLLKDLLLRDDGQHEARLLLSSIYVQQNRAAQAEHVLDEGLLHHPQHAPSVLFYAQMLAKQGRDSAAINLLQNGLHGAGDNAEFHALLAGLHQRSGNSVAAARSYLLALRLESSRGEWWVGLGIASEKAGDLSTAETAYNEASQHPLSSEVEKYAELRRQGLMTGKVVSAKQDRK